MGQLEESAIDPDVPIVDTHFHLWNAMGSDYFAAQFLNDVHTGHNVVQSVHVECDTAYDLGAAAELRPVGETRFVVNQLDTAPQRGHALAAGIIGSANLLLGNQVKPVLEAHMEAGNGRFRGVRARTAFDHDPAAGYPGRSDFPQHNILDSAAFRQGLACLEALGLVLDVWGFHPQLPQLHDVLRHFPGLVIVLNHLGGPLGVGRYASDRDAAFRHWLQGMRAMAKLPNVHVKLSGVGVTRLGLGFERGNASSRDIAALAGRHVRECVNIFGPQRCIFGSNYPVDQVVAPYAVLINGYKTILADLSPDERNAIFCSNARRVYRLAGAAGADQDKAAIRSRTAPMTAPAGKN